MMMGEEGVMRDEEVMRKDANAIHIKLDDTEP